MEQYYVYEYLDEEDDIAYIGKTINLQKRIKQHCSENKFQGLNKIRYIICKNKNEMDNLENHLITNLQPYLNIDCNQFSFFSEDYPSEIKWIEYDGDINYSPSRKDIKKNKYNKQEIIERLEGIIRISENKDLPENMLIARKDYLDILKEQLIRLKI